MKFRSLQVHLKLAVSLTSVLLQHHQLPLISLLLKLNFIFNKFCFTELIISYFLRSSSDGNSVDSFNSDFGPWKDSQAESSGFEDDFDLLSSTKDMDYLKKPFTKLKVENSPPPPSLPPPMLPPDALNVLLNGPKLPPRPNSVMVS